MEGKADLSEIEKRLTVGEISKQELRDYLKLIEPLSRYKLHDILIRGIPWPDGIKARYQIDPGQVGDFSSHLGQLKHPALRGWRVFPLGIPFPDIFNVEVDLGRPNEIVNVGGKSHL